MQDNRVRALRSNVDDLRAKMEEGVRLEAEAKAEAQVIQRLLRCLLTYADVC